MTEIFSIVRFILVAGRNVNEDNSCLMSAYLLPLMKLWNPLEIHLCWCFHKHVYSSTARRYDLSRKCSLLVPRTEHHLSSFKCGFLNIFSCQNLLRGLTCLLFLLQWNKCGAKKCLKNQIPFDFCDNSTLANQGAGKTIEKLLKELPWNQQSPSATIEVKSGPTYVKQSLVVPLTPSKGKPIQEATAVASVVSKILCHWYKIQSSQSTITDHSKVINRHQKLTFPPSFLL